MSVLTKKGKKPLYFHKILLFYYLLVKSDESFNLDESLCLLEVSESWQSGENYNRRKLRPTNFPR